MDWGVGATAFFARGNAQVLLSQNTFAVQPLSVQASMFACTWSHTCFV